MNDITPASVGTVELSNIGEQFIAEMSPGSTNLSDRIGFCSIDVYPNEGPIPHFHITPIDPKVAKQWKCCICLYEAKYFNHGSKQGTLSNKQLKILNSWLKETIKYNGVKISRWVFLCNYWDAQGNPKINVPKPPNSDDVIEQPDYTKTRLYR